jgi:kumamolisin
MERGIVRIVSRRLRTSVKTACVTSSLLMALLYALSAQAAVAKTPARSARSATQLIMMLAHPSKGLAGFVRSVSDPTSPAYRHYLTIEQLERRYGAKTHTKKIVGDWLRRHGMRGRVDPTGTFVTASISSPRQRAMFPAVASTATAGPAASSRLAVPRALQGAVTGVIDGDVPLPGQPTTGGDLKPGVLTAPLGSMAAATHASSVRPRTGTPAGCSAGQNAGPVPGSTSLNGYLGFTPNQYRTAYGFAGLIKRAGTSKRPRIALVEFAQFSRSDVDEFTSCFGLPTPRLNVISVPKGVGHLLPVISEADLDVEVVAAAAPNANVDVYEAPFTTGGILLVAAQPLRDPARRPTVESASYGECEPRLSGNVQLMQAVNSILEFEAAAGISVFASAGDTGSSDCNNGGNNAAYPIRSVDFPGSSPYITSVGGTNITLTAANHLASEVVWNNSPLAFGAGGGGTSLVFRHPWYQSLHGSAMQRSVPDVAMLADNAPGYAIYCTAADCNTTGNITPGWGPVGGTSAAAPLLAAGVADADQVAARHGDPPIGFINPLLYALKRHPDTGVLHDVRTGNNDLGELIDHQPIGCCSAKPGFDYTTGLGSVNVGALARAAATAYRHGHR